MLSSLSQEDKTKFLQARRNVLAQNPDLKTEQEQLTKQRQALQGQGSSASPEDRKALFQSWKAHEKKMKDAMLQADPSLSPIFDQIEPKMKEKFQQHASPNQDNADGPPSDL